MLPSPFGRCGGSEKPPHQFYCGHGDGPIDLTGELQFFDFGLCALFNRLRHERQVKGGVDQREVGVCLRKVAEQSDGWRREENEKRRARACLASLYNDVGAGLEGGRRCLQCPSLRPCVLIRGIMEMVQSAPWAGMSAQNPDATELNQLDEEIVIFTVSDEA
jgi:hypothetical protein